MSGSQCVRLSEMREALRELVYEATHLSPERDDGSHDCRISRKALDRARSALSTPVIVEVGRYTCRSCSDPTDNDSDLCDWCENPSNEGGARG